MPFRFRTPTDEQTQELDDPQPIVDCVLHRGADFWSVGSGDAAVERGSPYRPLMLALYFDGRDRFQLRHIVPGDYPAIAQAPGGADQAVINVGGTRMTLAAGTLLSREDAARIVRHYCETGEKHPDYEWR